MKRLYEKNLSASSCWIRTKQRRKTSNWRSAVRPKGDRPNVTRQENPGATGIGYQLSGKATANTTKDPSTPVSNKPALRTRHSAVSLKPRAKAKTDPSRKQTRGMTVHKS